MPPPDANANIARHLAAMAATHPQMPALKIPRGRTADGSIDYLSLTFAELDTEVSAWCARLSQASVRPGDRTLVMVKPGLPLIAGVFALFRLGAVPVIIDPGMGLKNFLACVASSHPRVLLGIPSAIWTSRIFRRAFASTAVRVSVSNSLVAQLRTKRETAPTATHPAASSDLAAILFTSGSTGAPKGVRYEHGMFEAQIAAIRETYHIEPGEVDLPMLPIFALFNPALGMTTIVPEMDPRRPGAADPARIVQAILQEKVTNSFGSPTLWLKVGAHCAEKGIKLPSLRRVLSAGAPVPAALWEMSRSMLPAGLLHSPYGATEALPVATLSSREIEPRSVRGACVGLPLKSVRVKIVQITDRPIATLDAAHELPAGQIGEIIVAGAVVTKSYDDRPSADAAAKIASAPKAGISDAADVWHRMGDCGFIDSDGRIWFVGRKAERVETRAGTLHTEPCEQVFRQHPRVTRCALIGLGSAGAQRPALVVEAKARSLAQRQAFAAELRALAVQHAHTAKISFFLFHPKFPVDVRHNAKIHRLTLAKWAQGAPGVETAMPA